MFSHDKNLITIKDTTNTGGKVLTASSSIFVDGLNVVCVSDKVKCGIVEHGISSVLEGSTSFFSNGKAVAVDGSKLSCGCYLVKNQNINAKQADNKLYQGQMRFVNKQNQKPFANTKYIAFINNEKIYGATDDDGLTQIFYSTKQEEIKIYLNIEDNLTNKDANQLEQENLISTMQMELLNDTY